MWLWVWVCGCHEEAKSDRLCDTAERGREGQRGAERGREGHIGSSMHQLDMHLIGLTTKHMQCSNMN